MTDSPDIILRYGAHAEKEYFEKLARYIGGILYSGNLLEASQAASASLMLKLRSGKTRPDLFINPMTYVFGPYVDPSTGTVRRDLDWIKSFRKKVKKYQIKEAYVLLAERLGGGFQEAVDTGEAISLDSGSVDRDKLVSGVVDYQLGRLSGILAEDPEIQALGGDGSHAVVPSAVLAPYFYCAEEWMLAGLDLMADLGKRTVASVSEVPVHVVACVSPSVLERRDFAEKLVESVHSTGAAAVWLWISKFDELQASTTQLVRYRSIVAELATRTRVIAYAGGFWNMMLAADGLSGVAHGVGYGERKPVIQVIGAAAPTVRYYLPAIAKRVGVPDIERAFPDIPVASAEEFFLSVCGCQICRGVLAGDVKRFSSFGEMHRSDPSKRAVQTATAAKLCRFHFLLARLNHEVQEVQKCDAEKRSEYLLEKSSRWREQPTLRADAEHIIRWAAALKGRPLSLEASFE